MLQSIRIADGSAGIRIVQVLVLEWCLPHHHFRSERLERGRLLHRGVWQEVRNDPSLKLDTLLTSIY